MQNNELQPQNNEDEIDLKELFITLIHSWKFIILTTLAFLLLSFIYSNQKEEMYESTILLELGSYESNQGKGLIDPVSDLIKELKVQLIYKRQFSQNKLKFYPIEEKLLEIIHISPSTEVNENALKEVLKFIQESDAKIIAKILNSISNEIQTTDNEINFINELLVTQKLRDEENRATKKLRDERRLPFLKNKLKLLKQLTSEEQNNLILLQSDSHTELTRASSSPTLQQIIFSYKNEVKDIEYEISEIKYKLDTKLNFSSDINDQMIETLFELSQVRSNLEREVKLIKDTKYTTQAIHELKTTVINKSKLIILLSTICGFIFSALLVILRQSFTQIQN